MTAPDPAEQRPRSQELFRELLESAPDAMVIVDQAGQVIIANEAFELLFGYGPGELVGTSIDRLVPHTVRPMHQQLREGYFLAPRRRAMGDSKALSGVRKDGSELPLEISLNPIHTGRGMVAAAAVRDATAHQETRDELHESERLYREMIESMHDLAQSIGIDGKLQFVNAAWIRTMGYTRSEAENLHFLDVIHPGSRASCEEKRVAVMRGDSLRNFATKFVTRGGRIVEVEGNITPLLRGGHVVATQGFFRDVTRRNQSAAQAKARAKQQLLVAEFGTFALQVRSLSQVTQRAVELVSQTLEVSLCMVLEVLQDGKGLRMAAGVGWNEGVAEQVLDAAGDTAAGYGLDSSEPLIAIDFRNESHLPIPPALAAHAVVSGVSMPIEGHERIFGVLGVYTREVHEFSEHDIAFLRSVANVIAEAVQRKHREAELAEAREATRQQTRLADVGAITAKIVHDLGNPIAGLMMQAQLMQRMAQQDGAEAFRGCAETVVATSRHLEAILREFRHFLRVQKVQPAPLDPRVFLQEVVQQWSPVASEKDIQLLLRLPPEAAIVHAEESKLRRVLDNLIKNSIEAIGHGPGEVIVELLRPEGGKLTLLVADSGPGIPDGLDVFRLFETTKPDGTGLGLPVCRQLIQAHGGDLNHEPRAPQGTVFRIELPAEKPWE